tara:strand:- start:635 stop:976 length:342 start_codon:yes stop_codon:yes gene_type:complete
MAAKASLVLERMRDQVRDMAHVFKFAPGMDAPYLEFNTWHDAHIHLRNLQAKLDELHKAAIATESKFESYYRDLWLMNDGSPDFTAEQYRDAWLAEQPSSVRRRNLRRLQERN